MKTKPKAKPNSDVTCNQCGKTGSKDPSGFCRHCGKKITESTEVEAPAED